MKKKLVMSVVLPLMVLTFSAMSFGAEQLPKVVVMGFSLNDMTGLPDAPEELKRIELLTKTFKDELGEQGVQLVPMSEKSKAEMGSQSATYFYDNPENAAELNKEVDADYLIIGVALKPTYLFVYPRVLMVDTKTKKVVMSKVAQLESSWSDESTTIRTGEKLAGLVKERLTILQSGN